jgi:arylformamidase
MANTAPKGWYDITVPLKQNMIILPIDPVAPRIYRYSDANLGAPVTMTMLEIISHTGTHIDTPLHFIPGGSTITDMPLDATIGPCRVIGIKDRKRITADELKPYNIKKGERVLFKTRNSPESYAGKKFMDDYVYFSDESAEYLAEKQVRLVGLDFITIGDFKNEASVTKTHTTFLNAGIYIMEDCALGDVPPGDYELLCMPLLVYHGDAAPCRAILRPLSK